jgi:hypothetical protein
MGRPRFQVAYLTHWDSRASAPWGGDART